MSDISDAIETAAVNPKRMKIGQVETEVHSLADQIKADNHINGNEAVNTQTARGIRFNKIVPPGGGL